MHTPVGEPSALIQILGQTVSRPSNFVSGKLTLSALLEGSIDQTSVHGRRTGCIPPPSPHTRILSNHSCTLPSSTRLQTVSPASRPRPQSSAVCTPTTANAMLANTNAITDIFVPVYRWIGIRNECFKGPISVRAMQQMLGGKIKF